jgi:hypothetical protein
MHGSCQLGRNRLKKYTTTENTRYSENIKISVVSEHIQVELTLLGSLRFQFHSGIPE